MIKPCRFLWMALLWLALSAEPVLADYISGAQSWTDEWKKLRTNEFTVVVNHAGDMRVEAGGVGLNFPQIVGRWRGKNFSTHDNLSGVGPWNEVHGSEEKIGDATLLTVEGVMTDMRIRQTLLIEADQLTYHWRGEIIDPSPELERIYGYDGAFVVNNKKPSPSFTAKLDYGGTIAAGFADEFGDLRNVKQLTVDCDRITMRIDFVEGRNVVVRRVDSPAHIPVRYSLNARVPRPLTPGAVQEYKIVVMLERSLVDTRLNP